MARSPHASWATCARCWSTRNCLSCNSEENMDQTATTIIVGLAIAWALQYGLAFWQMQRFYKRVAELRRRGQVSIGVAGSAWRRRQYAVLVVDASHHIVRVAQLSGWTIFATLKPVAGLDGRPMSVLTEEGADLPIG